MRGERGSSALGYAILVPLFFSLLFGAFYLWKVVGLRQGLDRSTYLAVRDLAEAPFPPHGPSLLAVARDRILEGLAAEGLVPREFARRGLDVANYLYVEVDLDPVREQPVEREGATSLLFEVRARLQIPWLFRVPLFSTPIPAISARHMGSFVHPQYSYVGRRPERDPERQDWHVSPFALPKR